MDARQLENSVSVPREAVMTNLELSYGANGPLADGIEIISPILLEPESAELQLREVWEVILTFCRVTVPPEAATHVHAKVANDAFTLEQVKALAVGTVFFSSAICDIFPSNKMFDTWAKSNEEAFPNETLFTMVEKLRDAKDIPSVVQLISPFREVAVNFQPLLDPRGTVEFRRATGVKSAEQCLQVVAFTLRLIYVCLFAGQAGFRECNLTAVTGRPSKFELIRALDESTPFKIAHWL
jgi:hypothetical protein